MSRRHLSPTFAGNADNDGVSRSVAKDIMGRKTEAIYARYRIVAQGERFALGMVGLERFVEREPLRRVLECVFGVLALESEPFDPRL